MWTDEVARVPIDSAESGSDTVVLPNFALEGEFPDFPPSAGYPSRVPTPYRRCPPGLACTHSPGSSRLKRHIGLLGFAPSPQTPGGHLPTAGNRCHGGMPRGGDGITVTTDPGRIDDVLLETLRLRSVAWGRPIAPDRPRGVIVDEHLVRWVGRGSARFTEGGSQALAAGIDVARVLQGVARGLGVPRLVALTGLPERTVRALASGRRYPGGRRCGGRWRP